MKFNEKVHFPFFMQRISVLQYEVFTLFSIPKIYKTDLLFFSEVLKVKKKKNKKLQKT